MSVDLRIMGAMTQPDWKMVMAEDLLCEDATLDEDRLRTQGHWLIGRLPGQAALRDPAKARVPLSRMGRDVSHPSKLGQTIGDSG